MPTDLDARIRGLVVEVVEHAPPAPDLDQGTEPTARPFRRQPIGVLVMSIVVVIATVAALLAVVTQSGERSVVLQRGATVTISLDSLPEGVTAHRFEGVPVFLVRDGNRVTTFLSDPQHIVGITEMWWCDPYFIAPEYGELFDATGRAVGGPAPTGLDRLVTSIRGNRLTIKLNEVVHDTRGRGSVKPEVRASCRGTVVAGRPRARFALPLEAIPEGVTPGRANSTLVFFVRNGNRVAVFVDDAQHLRGERIQWCPNEQVFYAPTHGEMFRIDGNAIQGPAHRDLARVRTTVEDGLVTIHSSHVDKGKVVGVQLGPTVPDPACEPS
jgi:Rieske Fe-S protein